MTAWLRDGAGWRCELPGNVTLFAVPERTKGLFGDTAARGTKWRAGVTRWCDATSTASRFGRDVYEQLCINHKDAKALAAATYAEAIEVGQ